jgi:hypothetical protein
LRNNQVGACQIIIEYIVKYQNNYASSYLFTKNLPILTEKGIEINGLLKSNIFSFDFDYDEWPGTHTNDGKYLRPYNDSIFNIRKNYKQVFPEEEFDELTNEDGSIKDSIDSSKIFKIKYSINLLPQIGTHIQLEEGGEPGFEIKTKRLMNQDVPFMKIVSASEELDIFNTVALSDLIEFKWD